MTKLCPYLPRRVKGRCAIRFLPSIRPSPAAGTSWMPPCVRALLGAFLARCHGAGYYGARESGWQGGARSCRRPRAQRRQSAALFARTLTLSSKPLLVTGISGADSRLVTASPSERAEMARIAANLLEEDLTRYLQLGLDLSGDLYPSSAPVSSRNRIAQDGAGVGKPLLD